MEITQDNKERIFEGIIKRSFNLEEMKAIKSQFDRNPQLFSEFEFYRRMIYAAQLLESKEAQERVELKKRINEYQKNHKKAPIVILFFRRYSYAIAASVALLLVSAALWLYYMDPDVPQQAKAQYQEIQYQEVAANNRGVAGSSDTTTANTTILLYPDDLERGYAFRQDTLVLYGKFDLKTLRYLYNLDTQKRTLFEGKKANSLEYVDKKRKF